jgi:hypothetical protein
MKIVWRSIRPLVRNVFLVAPMTFRALPITRLAWVNSTRMNLTQSRRQSRLIGFDGLTGF